MGIKGGMGEGEKHRQLPMAVDSSRKNAPCALGGTGTAAEPVPSFAQARSGMSRATFSSLLRRVQCLVEVSLDVGQVFDADTEADELGVDAGGALFLVGELLVRGRGGVDDQRLGVTDVCQVAAQLDVGDELLARLAAAFDACLLYTSDAADE